MKGISKSVKVDDITLQKASGVISIKSITSFLPVIKWARIRGSDGAIIDGDGVSTATKDATGKYTLNFTSNFSNANYCCEVNGEGNASYPENIDAEIQRGGQLVGSVKIVTINSTGGGASDCYDYINIFCIGK